MSDEFKPGDRVRYRIDGRTGTVDGLTDGIGPTLDVEWDGHRYTYVSDAYPADLELISRPWEQVTEEHAGEITEFPASTRPEPTEAYDVYSGNARRARVTPEKDGTVTAGGVCDTRLKKALRTLGGER